MVGPDSPHRASSGKPAPHIIELSAIAVPFPEVDPLVRPWRSRYDPSGRAGLVAHITLLVPFVRPEGIDDDLVVALGEALQPFEPFLVEFRRTGRFPDTLHLVPEPDRPFREITQSIVRRWPECPPYAGIYPDPTPHLTVVSEEDEEILEQTNRELQPLLPIHTRAETVLLFTGSNHSGWRERARFEL